MTTLATIGYEGSSLEDFVATLLAANINTLVDVREVPVSRRKGFSKNALREVLEDAGLTYVHLIGLGDPKEGRDAAREGRSDDFLKLTITPQTERLGWADGCFYFLHFFPGDTKFVLKDIMEGMQHFASIDYAEGPFQPLVKHPVHTHVQVVVVDQSKNNTIHEMMDYLKEYEKNEKEHKPIYETRAAPEKKRSQWN